LHDCQFIYFYFLKHSPKVLTMLFNYADVKVCLEESRRQGAPASSGGSSSPASGVPGGEVGGSVGVGMDFLTPDDGVGSMVDSEEELFVEMEAKQTAAAAAAKQEKDAVKLVFLLLIGQLGAEDEWPWNACGGLIGGARGKRFCAKLIRDPAHPHFGAGSHATHKATLEEGHGHIPSVADRANTESACLDPSVDADRFPGAFDVLLGRSLPYEEWIASFVVLPSREEMGNSSNVGHELVAEVMEKSSHAVSFAVAPAAKKPRLTNLISEILVSKSAKNLALTFE
jgi:hypothetical protein